MSECGLGQCFECVFMFEFGHNLGHRGNKKKKLCHVLYIKKSENVCAAGCTYTAE